MRQIVFTLALFAGLSAFASEDALVTRIQSLESAVIELRTAKTSAPFEVLSHTDQLRTQLGPVASKVYFHPESPWQVGLSSELFTYRETSADLANVLSVAPVLSFRPHRRIVFNSQFLFENGGSESRNTVTYQKGQSIVQMAYLDWLASEEGRAGVRVGHQLIPLGWTNTRSEPVTYLSVLKPEIERELIPSTWHENGISLWVDRPRADLQIGVFNSLDARGFRGETFLAGGRSQGQNAKADDLMGVFRVNAKSGWFLLGASIAAGNTAQKDPALRNAGFRVGEIHARARFSRFELQAMGVQAQLDDAEAISIYNGTSMGSAAWGNMGQAAFNLLEGKRELWLFARLSAYNLNSRMPPGYLASAALDKQVTTLGASYLPLPNVVIKSDYSLRKTSAATEEDELAFAVGVVF